MYTVGSLFYAIYFFVSFPMFYRMDEYNKGKVGRRGSTLCECSCVFYGARHGRIALGVCNHGSAWQGCWHLMVPIYNACKESHPAHARQGCWHSMAQMQKNSCEGRTVGQKSAGSARSHLS